MSEIYALLRRYQREFWMHVDQSADDDGCWEWLGQLHNAGYGLLTLPGVRLLAHRGAWILTHGMITGEQHVLHSCDNPPCVRPKHLFLGDQRSNMEDKLAKGRQPRGIEHGNAIAAGIKRIQLEEPERYAARFSHCRGERNANARLTEDEVRLIRQCAGTSRQIAPIFGISASKVRQIWCGMSWKHVV